MRLPSKKLFCENTSQYIKSLILKKRAGITLSESEERQLEKEALKETVSMTMPSNYHNRLASLQKPIAQPHMSDNYDIDMLSKEDIEALVKQMVLDMLDKEEHEDEDWNEILENLTKI